MGRVPKQLLVVTVAAVLAAGCAAANPEPEPTPRPTAPARPGEVRIVNLNAAMGYKNGPGDPRGTDASTADYERLAADILDQRGDVANLQEMALPAARELRAVLAGKTGDEWAMNFSYSSTATYYTGQEGESGPRPDYRDVAAGNAQLIRIGDGITAQEPLTPERGVMLPSVGRSFVGTRITTPGGTVHVYGTHLALAEQVPDEVRAGDVLALQETTEAAAVPTVVTGDFNQEIDGAPGGPHPSPRTVAAIRAFTTTHGYTDVARDQGPTLSTRRIDYLFARGLRTADTVRFTSRESDHRGLATTITVP
jgi:endonuclease/exonuclease/phosphatase family metal-dependent hydrolase